MKKTYEELMTLDTYYERLKYLQTHSKVGEDTFGKYRFINQSFYRSREWRIFRDRIICRDLGCDLGIPSMVIEGLIIIHHINPITYDDMVEHKRTILDPNNVICVSRSTHDAIHYGYDVVEEERPIIRKPNDTSPWRRI